MRKSLIFIFIQCILAISLYSQDTVSVKRDTVPALPEGQSIVTVQSVHDGDSYRVKDENGEVFAVRLWGVDCPEVISPPYVCKPQAYGPQTAEAVRGFLKGKRVLIDSVGVDMYGRLVASVYVPVGLPPDTKLINLSYYLLDQGMAFPLRRPFVTKEVYIEMKRLYENAKSARLGLHALPGYKVLPSTWRKRNSCRTDK